MKIDYLGHSAFTITDKHTVLLIDPFLTGNPLASTKAEVLHPTYILVTHGHSDHLGDAIEIAQRAGAVVICTFALAGTVFNQVDISTIAGNIGGNLPLPFGSIKLVYALHESGVAGGLACGFIINIGGKTIYFAGDTGLTKEMELLSLEGIDYAMLPIGDYYTMGPRDACMAVNMIKPQYVIPMHYNTFPTIMQDAAVFKQSIENETDARCIVMKPGEEITI